MIYQNSEYQQNIALYPLSINQYYNCLTNTLFYFLYLQFFFLKPKLICLKNYQQTDQWAYILNQQSKIVIDTLHKYTFNTIFTKTIIWIEQGHSELSVTCVWVVGGWLTASLPFIFTIRERSLVESAGLFYYQMINDNIQNSPKFLKEIKSHFMRIICSPCCCLYLSSFEQT